MIILNLLLIILIFIFFAIILIIFKNKFLLKLIKNNIRYEEEA